MSNLPDPHTLASLVSNVTQTMCGFSFGVADPGQRGKVTCFRMAVLEVTGGRPWRVALFSDQGGCTALGAALCQVEPDMLEDGMIEDSLCELLNMAAGQIKGLLSADQTLGLPKITAPSDLSPQSQAAYRDGILLRSQDAVNLMMWISQER
jgi:hypothetical protein